MKTLLKVFKSPWWDLFPAACFLVIAGAEGKAYWVGGVALIVWLFSLAIRNFTK